MWIFYYDVKDKFVIKKLKGVTYYKYLLKRLMMVFNLINTSKVLVEMLQPRTNFVRKIYEPRSLQAFNCLVEP